MVMQPQTWHHGLVARWWFEFNHSGPEIDYFRRFVESGQPALDVACGTGRLLVPYLRDGLDVDGCDISPDMVALCREAAEQEGLAPNLYVQSLHELELPRRYRTIFVCGGFGLGATRAQDREALHRLHAHLEPGGLLLLDNEAPYANAGLWKYWLKAERAALPRPRNDAGDRRPASDGSELELRSRVLAFDPLAQQATWEMLALQWRDGVLVTQEEHRLTATLYFRDELALMLEQAGFADIAVRGGYEDRPPTSDDDFLVFSARRPGSADSDGR